MNEKIQSAIKETLESAIDSALSAIQYNVIDTIKGLLYSLNLENERKNKTVLDVDRLISLIFETSRYTGPEGEEWPTWAGKEGFTRRDARTKEANAILKRLSDLLQEHGIQQSWNIGRASKAGTLPTE